MKNVVLLLAAAALSGTFGTAQAFAHHPIVDVYLQDRTESVEGELVQFLLRNPHSTLLIETRNNEGVRQRWALEWAAGLRLSRQGITPDTLKRGDHVVVTGNPGRNPADHRLRVRTIARPKDGWKWVGGFEER